MMFKQKTGVELALITAVVSGVSVFVNKWAVGIVKPPVLFTGTKNLMVGLLILSLLLITGKVKQLMKLSGKQWLQLSLIGVVGGFVPFYLFFNGLVLASVTSAAMIHKSLVFWVALLAWPVLKEKLSILKLAGVLALFYANVLVGGFAGFSFSTGELMILGATLFWAVENVIAKKALVTIDPDVLAFGRMGIGSALLLITATIQSPAGLNGLSGVAMGEWSVVGGTALVLLAYVTIWYRALQKAEATTVTALLVPATLVTNLLSAIFISRTWNVAGTASLIMTGLGVGLVVWAGRQDYLKLAKN